MSAEVFRPVSPDPEEVGYIPFNQQERPSEIVWPNPDIRLNGRAFLGGTCGPEDIPDWRLPFLQQVQRYLAGFGKGYVLDESKYFSVRVPEWTKKAGTREANEFARASRTVGPINDLTEGLASESEDFMRDIRRIFMGQESFYYHELGVGHESSVQVARQMGALFLQRFTNDVPHGAHFAISMEDMAHQFAVSLANEGPVVELDPIALPRPTLEPKILLSGSSSNRWENTWQRGVLSHFNPAHVEHTHVPHFSQNLRTNIKAEMQRKMTVAVNLCVVKNDATSYGAGVDIGALTELAALHPDRHIGMLVERYEDQGLPPTRLGREAVYKTANRQRGLAMEHLGRLFLDLPWLRKQVYVATSMEDLLTFGQRALEESRG